MPIVIGPFSNVPAPGDPITSPWAQQLTQYVVSNAPVRSIVVMTRFTQSIVSATVTDVTWDTEIADADNWKPAGTSALLTVPAGKGGQYTITVVGSWSGSPGASAVLALALNGAAVADVVCTPGILLFSHVLTVVRTLAAGTTVKAIAYQNSGAPRDLTARLEIM